MTAPKGDAALSEMETQIAAFERKWGRHPELVSAVREIGTGLVTYRAALAAKQEECERLRAARVEDAIEAGQECARFTNLAVKAAVAAEKARADRLAAIVENCQNCKEKA
jgi:hypothetical protein